MFFILKETRGTYTDNGVRWYLTKLDVTFSVISLEKKKLRFLIKRVNRLVGETTDLLNFLDAVPSDSREDYESDFRTRIPRIPYHAKSGLTDPRTSTRS